MLCNNAYKNDALKQNCYEHIIAIKKMMCDGAMKCNAM